MVLFSYILTLISSRKINFSLRLSPIFILIVCVVLIVNFESYLTTPRHLRDLYNLRSNLVLYLLAIYLFLVLVVVVKLSIRHMGTLKTFCSHEI